MSSDFLGKNCAVSSQIVAEFRSAEIGVVLKDGAMELEFVADDPEEKFLTTGVSWNQYEDLLTKLGDRSRYRVTYLEGVLEIMSPSRRHEVWKKHISRLLEARSEERRVGKGRRSEGVAGR